MSYNTFKLHYDHYMFGILRLAMATTSMITLTLLLPPSMSSVSGVLPIPIWKGMVMFASSPLNTVFNLQEITICLTYRTLEMLGEQFECQHCVDRTTYWTVYSQQDKHTGQSTASRTNILDDLQSAGQTYWTTYSRQDILDDLQSAGQTYWTTYSQQDILDDLQLTGHTGRPTANRTNILEDLQPTGQTYWMTYSHRTNILDDLQPTGQTYWMTYS